MLLARRCRSGKLPAGCCSASNAEVPAVNARTARVGSGSPPSSLTAMMLRFLRGSCRIRRKHLPAFASYVVRRSSSTMLPQGSRLAFLYGSREVLWSGIAPTLLAANGAVGGALARCERIVQDRLGWSLRAAFAAQHFANEQVREPSLT